MWWDQLANKGNFNAPFAVTAPAAAAAGSGVAAVARLPYHLDVFWVAPDGSVQSTWWDQNANAGRFNPPFPIAPPGSALPGGWMTALARLPQHLDVFWPGPDGTIRTTRWDQNANNAKWNVPFVVAAARAGAAPPKPGRLGPAPLNRLHPPAN